MKKGFLLFCLVSFISFTAFAQENTTKSSIKIGDTFKVGEVKNNTYKFIKFPRANFIIKKGGIYTFKNIKGKNVVVTSIEQKASGKEIVTIKLENGNRFFNSHKYVTVDISNALKESELLLN